MSIVIATIVATLLVISGIGSMVFFAYGMGKKAGYNAAVEKHKQPELTPEQKEQRRKFERMTEQYNRMFAYTGRK